MNIGPFSVGELLLIFLIILILLGPKKLPELAKALGEAVNEFRKAASGTYDTARQAAKEAKEAAQSAVKSVESPVVEVVEESKKKA